MEDDDTQVGPIPDLNVLDMDKLRELVMIAKEAELSYIRIGEVEIQFPTTETGDASTSVVGFEATGTPDVDITDPEDRLHKRHPGYARLFKGQFPQFPKPKAE